ncbi:hypothetical protein HK097_011542 [Rhizophlyctis rosea]|uniref:Peptidase A1 domain-containing protein n=1 Tax=Rhizophlyctis rosea TaxID=64517 RepID=A0AAD5S7P6_9FUNG|nr:hypothetical protein HK097_011542 [Rhizophlyctis rosea]
MSTFQSIPGFAGPILNRGLSALVPLPGTAGCDFNVLLTNDKQAAICFVSTPSDAAKGSAVGMMGLDTPKRDLELTSSQFMHAYVLAGLTYLDNVDNHTYTAVAGQTRTSSPSTINSPSTSTLPFIPGTTPTTPVTTTETPSPRSLASPDTQQNNTGIIAGGVVGGLAVLAIFAGAVIYMRTRKSRPQQQLHAGGHDIPEYQLHMGVPKVQNGGGV